MKVQVSSIWKKKIWFENNGIRIHSNPDGPVYYANH